jgi:hypothetical protein
MAESRFIMLGVIHGDQAGPCLLEDWLHRIRPEVITLEFSQYGLQLRRERGEAYRGRIQQVRDRLEENGDPCSREAESMLTSYISLPYEFEAASVYASEHAVPFYLIDMDFFSYLKLRKIDELMSEDNIRKVLSDVEGPIGNQEEAMAGLFFEKGLKAFPYDDEMYIRDKYMAEKIRVLMEYHTNRRFLHLCGWRHLLDPSNVYAALEPTKVFSHDKTLCF